MILARRFKLTIEATPPTQPGIKKKVQWVREDEKPDLRVRTMGQPGADVMLVSEQAKNKVSLFDSLEGRWYPVWFEIKNVEAWSLDAKFWSNGLLPAVMTGAYHQAVKRAPRGWKPIAVVGKNYMPPLAIWFSPIEDQLEALKTWEAPMLVSNSWIVTPFDPYFTGLLSRKS